MGEEFGGGGGRVKISCNSRCNELERADCRGHTRIVFFKRKKYVYVMCSRRRLYIRINVYTSFPRTMSAKWRALSLAERVKKHKVSPPRLQYPSHQEVEREASEHEGFNYRGEQRPHTALLARLGACTFAQHLGDRFRFSAESTGSLRLGWSDWYSWIVSSVPPFSVTTCILSPCIQWPRTSQSYHSILEARKRDKRPKVPRAQAAALSELFRGEPRSFVSNRSL